METILCENCNREYQYKFERDWDESRREWVERDNGLCPDCREDLSEVE